MCPPPLTCMHAYTHMHIPAEIDWIGWGGAGQMWILRWLIRWEGIVEVGNCEIVN